MSHTNEQNPLSQPLRVETDDPVHPEENYFEEEANFNGNSNDNSDSLGPLPPKWEKAYTESGEVYFIE